MIRAIFHPPWLVVAAVCSIHITWGLLILLGYHSSINATALHALVDVFHHAEVTGWVLLISGIMAAAASAIKRPYGVILLFPQQSLLFISATGAVAAIITGQYADGVPRPWDFILADQVVVPVLAFWHAAACIITQVKYE